MALNGWFMNAIPGYKVFDYMLIIEPGEALADKILSVRQQFNEKFKIMPPKYKPNILLESFKQYGMAEERIISRLNTIAMGFQPFKVELPSVCETYSILDLASRKLGQIIKR